MTMKSKTMEFDACIVNYNYGSGSLTIEAKNDRDHPDNKGAIVLKGSGLQDLREALEDIGQQVPDSSRRNRLPHD